MSPLADLLRPRTERPVEWVAVTYTWCDGTVVRAIRKISLN